MNIIEDENKTSDTNQAVCSITEGHQLYPLIVTYRCQANTQRIEVNLRSGILKYLILSKEVCSFAVKINFSLITFDML